MAERYQFQYYPVTGKLTGNQMIEQTEQAINELAQNVYEGSAQVEVINTIVNQAEQNAEQALAKATQALESAGRVYLDELTAVNLNNYYNSELLYIGDETSENLPVADTGFLEVKTNDSMTNAAQVFIADSSGLLYFRQATIIPQEVGGVTTYNVTWGTWFTYATQEYVSDNYLPLTGGTITGDLSVGGIITGNLDGNATNATNAPTPAATDNSTKIATTAYVKANVPVSVGDANIPVYTDSNGKIVSTGKSFANYATLASPALTGNPTAPTAGVSTDSTQIATTAYVKDCVPKSVGGTQRPVYTNSNGVITACASTGSAGGLEGVDSFDLVRNGWIRYESGLQICWTMAQMTNSGYTWTFPKSFTVIPNVQVTTSYGGSFSGTNATRMISWAGNESTTNCKIYSNTDATSNIYKEVIAIGKWK